MPNFTFYVLPDGSDANSGESWQHPLATLEGAIAKIKDAKGGRIKLGPGKWTIPPSGIQLGVSNISDIPLDASNMPIRIPESYPVSYEGMAGLTIFEATKETQALGFVIGADDFTKKGGEHHEGGVYHDIHISGITIDLTITQTTSVTIKFGSTEDCSMRNCKIIGGYYMCVLGEVLQLPLTQIGQPATKVVIADNEFSPNPLDGKAEAFAVVNSRDCQIIRNRVFNESLFLPFTLDVEANDVTDYVSNLIFAENIIENCGPTQLSVGGSTEITRSTGIRLIDNHFLNSNGINCGLPGVIISRNVFRRDKRAREEAKSWAVRLSHINHATMFAPDGCTIEGNVFENAGTSRFDESIIIIESSFNRVSGNIVRENRPLFRENPPPTERGPWVVEELQLEPCLLSGGATGVPNGMGIPVAALQIIGAMADPASIITHAEWTVPIAPNLTDSDRVDVIVVDVEGIASAKSLVPPHAKSLVPPHLDAVPPQICSVADPPGMIVNCPRVELPLAVVYVPKGATSISADNIRDYRHFAPGSNVIDQDYPPTPMTMGTVKLISPTSYRVPRRKPDIVTDRSDRLVLDDAPRLYLPMTEISGPLMADLSGADNDGISAGGVLFNQSAIGPVLLIQLPVPERRQANQGAKFDGLSGFVQVESRPEIADLLASAAFTIELQIMPDTLDPERWIMAKGVVGEQGTVPQFGLTLDTDGHVHFRFGALPVPPAPPLPDVVSTRRISVGTLTHLAVVWEPQQVTFYINGKQDQPKPAGPPTSSQDYPVLIGGADGGGHFGLPTKFFKGTIRKVALYSTALKPERIQSHAMADGLAEI